MKKLQPFILAVAILSVMVWTAGRIFFTLPDWAVRLNGGIMLITMPPLAFFSVRLKVKNPQRCPKLY